MLEITESTTHLHLKVVSYLNNCKIWYSVKEGFILITNLIGSKFALRSHKQVFPNHKDGFIVNH